MKWYPTEETTEAVMRALSMLVCDSAAQDRGGVSYIPPESRKVWLYGACLFPDPFETEWLVILPNKK